MKNILQNHRLMRWLGIIVVLLFIGIIVLIIFVQRQYIIDSHKESLQILANEKTMIVSDFLESQKEKLAFISSMNVFKEVVMNPKDIKKISAAKNTIDELKNTISGISILSNEGIVIVGEIDLPGTDYSKQAYFSLTEKKVIYELYYDPLREKDYYAIVGPIYDTTEKNKIIGIGTIAFDLDIAKIGGLMKEFVENENREVYLINERGLLLSRSKYVGKNDVQGVLVQEVKTDVAEVCINDLKKFGKDYLIEEHGEEVFKYLNYTGDEVYGTHSYILPIRGCIIAEEKVANIEKFSVLDIIKSMFNKKSTNEK